MEALYLLVPLSVLTVALALWVFFGAAESGQFDDLDGPAFRVLRDDDRGGAWEPGTARCDAGDGGASGDLTGSGR